VYAPRSMRAAGGAGLGQRAAGSAAASANDAPAGSAPVTPAAALAAAGRADAINSATPARKSRRRPGDGAACPVASLQEVEQLAASAGSITARGGAQSARGVRAAAMAARRGAARVPLRRAVRSIAATLSRGLLRQRKQPFEAMQAARSGECLRPFQRASCGASRRSAALDGAVQRWARQRWAWRRPRFTCPYLRATEGGRGEKQTNSTAKR
jgi:hypothetical protein